MFSLARNSYMRKASQTIHLKQHINMNQLLPPVEYSTIPDALRHALFHVSSGEICDLARAKSQILVTVGASSGGIGMRTFSALSSIWMSWNTRTKREEFWVERWKCLIRRKMWSVVRNLHNQGLWYGFLHEPQTVHLQVQEPIGSFEVSWLLKDIKQGLLGPIYISAHSVSGIWLWSDCVLCTRIYWGSHCR